MAASLSSLSSFFDLAAVAASDPSSASAKRLHLKLRGKGSTRENSPSMSTSFAASSSAFLRIACAICFSNLRCFFLLRARLGPLVGSKPGRAPRRASALSRREVNLAVERRLRACLRVLEARAIWRLRETVLGFLTDGIFVCVGSLGLAGWLFAICLNIGTKVWCGVVWLYCVTTNGRGGSFG